MKVADFIQRRATDNWLLKPFLAEWQAVILVTVLIKVTTSGVSITAGYYYFKNLLQELFNNENASVVFSIVILVLIELLASYLLAKFFKFALRMRFITAGVISIFVFGVYFLSWQSSCRGVELYQIRNTDMTVEITEDFSLKENQARQEFESIKAEKESAIENIKENPQVWKNGKPSLLSADQQKLIAQYYEDIKNARVEFGSKLNEIKKEQESALADNKQTSSDEGKKYYWIVAIVMICQIVSTGMIWFCYSRIAIEKDKQILYKENLEVIDGDLNKLIRGRTIQVFGLYKSALANMFAQTNPETFNVTLGESPKNPSKTIGFGQEPHASSDASDASTAPVPPESKPNIGICVECGNTFEKHRENQIFCCAEHRISHHNATAKRKINIKPSSIK